MPRRTGSTLGNSRGSANRRGNTGGIRKTTRTRQPPHRYGQPQAHNTDSPATEETATLESESDLPHINANTNILQNGSEQPSSRYSPSTTESLQSEIPAFQNHPQPSPETSVQEQDGITLEDMPALLQAHEEYIVNQVVQRLDQNNRQVRESPLQPHESPLHRPRAPQPTNPTIARIAQLENQLAEL